MRWNWREGGGMWAPPDPNHKPEFHTLWEDIKAAALYVCGVALVWLLLWPVAAIAFWWEGRMDAAFRGPFVVGYVWLAAAIFVAWSIAWLFTTLRLVPIWAWLIIIPLLGIWRHLAAINRRAEEVKKRSTD